MVMVLGHGGYFNFLYLWLNKLRFRLKYISHDDSFTYCFEKICEDGMRVVNS